MKSDNGKRDYWYDNAKALLIILVVMGHVVQMIMNYSTYANGCPKWISALNGFIYVFHVPVFLIISGRFSKRRVDNGNYKAVINKLIIPYMCAQLAIMVFDGYTGSESISKFSFIRPFFGMWYILALAIFQFITPKFKNCKALLPISFIMAIAVQYGKVPLYGVFMRTVTFYPFFLAGYYMSEWDLKVIRKPLFRIVSVAAFVALFMIVWQHTEKFPTPALSMKRVYTQVKPYFIDLTELDFLIYRILTYGAGIVFFFFLMGIVPTKKIKGFTYIGANSNYAYILHIFIILLLKYLGKEYRLLDNFNTGWKLVVYVLSAIPLTMLLTSPPVRKATKWLVSPDVHVENLLKNEEKKKE